MKTTRTPKRAPLTGTDQLLAILLAKIDDGDSLGAAHFLMYQDRARQILASPQAFDGGSDTLRVIDCVLKGERLTVIDHEKPRADRLLPQIMDGDKEPVTGSAEDFRGLLYRAIDEATLYGAALMFELLEGGK